MSTAAEKLGARYRVIAVDQRNAGQVYRHD
jgi:pimeloyl-ACP methyl ester carboxylesterase